VEDTGPGIPPEHEPFVFERFYRVDPSRSRSDGGTGIGLTIAKSVVEGHGGRIWVDRANEGGAAFRFTLPLAPIGTREPLGPVSEPPSEGTQDQHANERRPSGIVARQG
jgi:signal transduction histidine kinase